MNRKRSAVLDIIVALIGLLFSIVVLNIALVSIQASSGDEPLIPSLIFFMVSFALAFGLGAACTLRLGGRFTAMRAAIAFAAGGAAGGAILAGSLRLVDQFEPALRALTGGGPIGHFLLLGLVGALAAPIAVGTWLLRRMTGNVRPTSRTGRQKVSTSSPQRSNQAAAAGLLLRSITSVAATSRSVGDAVTCRSGFVRVVAIAGLISIASPAYSSTESRALTREAFSRAYELRFAQSLAVLADARRSDPSDPAPLRAAAAVTWMEILFAQGVATFAAFDGDASGDAVSRPSVPPHLAERFLMHAGDAVRLAQRRAAAAPDDLDAQYQLGASIGLMALYRGTVEGRTFAAFTEGRRAVGIMDRIRHKDPGHRESALIPGLYRYSVSTLSWPRRMLAAAAGLPGDRDEGIRLLETAAAESAETATDAALVLMIVFNREGRHAEATAHLQGLIARHPANRLLRLNLAATALDAARHNDAEKEVTEVLARTPRFEEPAIPGERALWRYLRGAARAALLDPRARDDLREAVQDAPRDWVRARAHVELARLALRDGQTQRARAELDAAEHVGRRGGDHVAVAQARRLWREKRAS